jgi:ABC-type antimicrobial peptide transport system permease subunit
MIPGFILGVGVGKYAMSLQQTEYFSISFVVYGSTFLMVAIGIILILLICQIPSLQYVKKVELAKATKERGG